ncbi:uncharacterized protein FA14DRAFT_161578 [Meira miltonrushii]|uniref:Uncharacterized protein n=1 Tax=Meira miltonrushii TaxID=1280837 RepID=A0A316V925_9BASI|nr:uncharacterized protein FA14DRAFT_161578 [Meira miltonrushii]PWN33990.1 hypothetical protein FA14DRAFT_161578 [Meira miltonrushii]
MKQALFVASTGMLVLLANMPSTLSSDDCGKGGFISCEIACPSPGPGCESLGYDTSISICGCKCNRCSDGLYYSAWSPVPLTEEERKECPDVKYPCN